MSLPVKALVSALLAAAATIAEEAIKETGVPECLSPACLSCLVTGDQIGSEFLLFDDEEQELVVCHFLDRLRRGSIELAAHPIVFGVSVDAEFDGVVG